MLSIYCFICFDKMEKKNLMNILCIIRAKSCDISNSEGEKVNERRDERIALFATFLNRCESLHLDNYFGESKRRIQRNYNVIYLWEDAKFLVEEAMMKRKNKIKQQFSLLLLSENTHYVFIQLLEQREKERIRRSLCYISLKKGNILNWRTCKINWKKKKTLLHLLLLSTDTNYVLIHLQNESKKKELNTCSLLYFCEKK